MRYRDVVIGAALLMAACGGRGAPSAADSTAAAKHFDDSILALHTRQAPALADSARHTMAALLKHPESAVFDSFVVVQPPSEDGGWPAPWVCGRIGGKPGLGGRSTPRPFIYQSRLNVFVLDQSNGQAFAALRAKGCGNPAVRVLFK